MWTVHSVGKGAAGRRLVGCVWSRVRDHTRHPVYSVQSLHHTRECTRKSIYTFVRNNVAPFNTNFRSHAHLKAMTRGMPQLHARRMHTTMEKSLGRLGPAVVSTYLKDKHIDYLERHTSVTVDICPYCTSQELSNTPHSLYINKSYGSYECKRCHHIGSWHQIKKLSTRQHRNKIKGRKELAIPKTRRPVIADQHIAVEYSDVNVKETKQRLAAMYRDVPDTIPVTTETPNPAAKNAPGSAKQATKTIHGKGTPPPPPFVAPVKSKPNKPKIARGYMVLDRALRDRESAISLHTLQQFGVKLLVASTQDQSSPYSSLVKPADESPVQSRSPNSAIGPDEYVIGLSFPYYDLDMSANADATHKHTHIPAPIASAARGKAHERLILQRINTPVTATACQWKEVVSDKVNLVPAIPARRGLFGFNLVLKEQRDYERALFLGLDVSKFEGKHQDGLGPAVGDLDSGGVAKTAVEFDTENDTESDVEGDGVVHSTPSFDLNPQTVVVTADEWSAMAVYQATGQPAVAVSVGNLALSPDVLPLLEASENVILWLDQSDQTTKEFAERIGLNRCQHVPFESDGHRNGSALDALVRGGDAEVFSVFENVTPITNELIVTMSQMRDDIFRNLTNPQATAGTMCTILPRYNTIIKGHRRGELTVLTGPTGSGKTSLLSALSLDYCQQGVATLWGSFEIKNTQLGQKMLQQFSKSTLENVNKETFDSQISQFSQLPMYYMTFFGSTMVQEVLATMDYAVYQHSVQHIVLDNLQFMLSSVAGTRGKADKFDLQDSAISEFRRFATEKNVHVTLVVHPRKERDDEALQIASIGGTAKASQEADNVLALQIPRRADALTVRVLQVMKNRFDGTRGSVGYRYDKDTNEVIPVDDVPMAIEEEKERNKLLDAERGWSFQANGLKSASPFGDLSR